MVESIKELRKICGSKKKQPLYMEAVSMKISIYITKLYLYTKLSADYVTMGMIALIVLGSFFMSVGTLMSIFIGIAIIHLTIFLDNVNGEVARYWKEDGIIGTFLEESYHKLAVPFIFLSLSYGITLKTGLNYILIFGFLAAIFGRPIVLGAVKDAVISERMREISKGKKPQKISIKGKVNVKGGGNSAGNVLYRVYDRIREFWVFPANIVHITIISIIELANIRYGWFSSYSLLVLYVIIYGTVSLLIQFAAFVVNYRGRTFDHYYKQLFNR